MRANVLYYWQLLERKEYFGKYGKILKLSISRPTTATQQASSNCYSVYITYAREEDAVRCIQSVHNYSMDGNSLRASFGTTKYCHSWLRNMICSNPDCLYLHDIGCQDDSFSKDEIISACSRNRAPQVAMNNLQQRARNVLPAAEVDIGTNGTPSSKSCLRKSSSNTTKHAKSANISSERSLVLPASASWGSRVPNKCSTPATTPCLQNPVKQKPDFLNSSTSFLSSVSSIKCISAWDDHVPVLSKEPDNRTVESGSRASEVLNLVSSMHDQPVVSDDSSESTVVAESSLMISAWEDDAQMKPPEGRNIMLMDSQSSPMEMTSSSCKSTEIMFDVGCNYAWDDDVDAASNQITDPCFYQIDGKTTSLEALKCCSNGDSQTSLSEDTRVCDTSCTSDISCSPSQLSDRSTGDKDRSLAREIISVDSFNVKDEYQSKEEYQVVSSNNCSKFNDESSDAKFCQTYANREAERQSSTPSSLASVATDSECFLIDLPGWASNQQSDAPFSVIKTDSYSLATHDQREEASNVSIQKTFSYCSLNPPKMPFIPTSNSCEEDPFDLQYLNDANYFPTDEGFSRLRDHTVVLPAVPKQDQQDDYAMHREVFEAPDMRQTGNKPIYVVKSDDLTTIKTEVIDSGERSIISNMLSLDFDPWDDSVHSSDNLAKFLSGMGKKVGSSALSWKLQNNNQSRFSFARQENLANDFSLAASHAEKSSSSTQESFKDAYYNNSLHDTTGGSSVFLKNSSLSSSNNPAGTPRPKMPAPPGFSVPNKGPPPGFSSQERYENSHKSATSENLFQGSTPNPFNLNAGDVEFIDPAILAVGKNLLPLEANDSGFGLTSNAASQFRTTESNNIQPLMQYSISAFKDQRFSNNNNIVGGLSTMNDVYFSSRFPAQFHNPSHLPFTQPQLRTSTILNNQSRDLWNVLNDREMGMTEIVQNERFGHDSYIIPGKEEHSFRLSSSNYLYSRPYGM
ncbi:uncharacterized protein LOC110020616 isoform X2 [Phalaenopsis equestris]|uniref:uncharacterized protein LOC110020616 isoform X2 n=1 Tax=Phalaenopsis equestris TaxID=78828 RepID=UPI0009E18BDB|nr:uncharacterized protein LOC110020616 isoform X2 [Phalaenopsis equestris]